MKKTARLQKTNFITLQDVIHVFILVTLSILFCLIPMHALGQPSLGSITNEALPGFDTLVPSSASAPAPAVPEPVMSLFPQTNAPTTEPIPVAPLSSPAVPSAVPVEEFFAPAQTPLDVPSLPEPAAAPVTPMTARQFSAAQSAPAQTVPAQSQHYLQTQLQSRQQTSAVGAEHPFAKYWGIPDGMHTQIIGKSMSVSELLAGTRSSAVRRQLLEAYWELSGLLAIYHFRCENERLASGTPQDNTAALLREQRRTAEVEFIKQQWVLAELLKQTKGHSLRQTELPIPADYPLYLRYQTFAEQIARSERARYLGRMIPIQEQLIESKNGTWKAASGMLPSVSHPAFAVSTQRTAAFLDLTKAVIEYNQMIAEYALETIPPNVSHQQLVGAVVRVAPEVTSLSLREEQQSVTQVRYEF